MKYFRKIQIALIRIIFIAATIVMMGGYPSTLYAASELPHTFSPGQTISSAQVNANFQALSARIAALQAQLAPVSVVGTYDFVLWGEDMSIVRDGSSIYVFKSTGSTGTLVFSDTGTVNISSNNNTSKLEIINTPWTLTPNNVVLSMVSDRLTTKTVADFTTSGYAVNGSTVTIGTIAAGTVSADGKICILRFQPESGRNGIMVGLKRQ
jgi:hypothetical protein